MKRVDAVEELEMEGTGCGAVNLAAGAGLHCHGWLRARITILRPETRSFSLAVNKASFDCVIK